MYWAIEFHNYGDEYFTYVFDNYDAARKTFQNLCLANRDKDEFEMGKDKVSWFDADCNQDSTYVFFHKTEVFSEPMPPEDF